MKGIFDKSLDRYDGEFLSAVNPPKGAFSESLFVGNKYNPSAARDMERIAGKGIHATAIKDGPPEPGSPLESPHIRAKLTEWGYDPDTVLRSPEKDRILLVNRLIKYLRTLTERNNNPFDGHTHAGTLADALEVGNPEDEVIISDDGMVRTTLGVMQKTLLQAHGLTPTQYRALPTHRQDRIYIKICNFLRKQIEKTRTVKLEGYDVHVRGPNTEAMAQERNDLHQSLRAWEAGPLVLEKPQGSSFHHLVEYDRSQTKGGFAKILRDDGYPQMFVVENDWARVLGAEAVSKGRVPLPFGHCCFEFRISGVRVLAQFHEDEANDDLMYLCYGRDGIWVSDDFVYRVHENTMRKFMTVNDGRNNWEFARVARMVLDNVRASCIMIDAALAEPERQEVSQTPLAKKRVATGKSPLRDYFVVRLLKPKRHVHYERTRVASTLSGDRAPQRGHFRIGTWVHYDDQDSGKEQYVNEGGFIVSRTWRRWHFAGDPNNIIQKEYRL